MSRMWPKSNETPVRELGSLVEWSSLRSKLETNEGSTAISYINSREPSSRKSSYGPYIAGNLECSDFFSKEGYLFNSLSGPELFKSSALTIFIFSSIEGKWFRRPIPNSQPVDPSPPQSLLGASIVFRIEFVLALKTTRSIFLRPTLFSRALM